MKFTVVTLVACILLLSQTNSFAQAPSSSVQTPDTNALKREVVRELFVKTHARDNVNLLVRGLLDRAQKAVAENEEATSRLGRFQSKMDSLVVLMLDSIAPTYYKYYSLTDLQALTKMYDTPIMQYTLRIMPSIMTESMGIGQRMGARLMEDIMRSANTEEASTSDNVGSKDLQSAPAVPQTKKAHKKKTSGQ